MTSKAIQARWLALSLLSGRWDRAAVAERLSRALPPEFTDLDKLGARLGFHFDEPSPPGVDRLAWLLLEEPLLEPVFKTGAIKGPLLDPPEMGATPAGLKTLPLPRLTTWSDVSEWLGLSDQETAWFADSRSQQASLSEKKLHHYNYFWVPKRSGSLRLIEAPKSRLKTIQQKILREILNRLPPHPNSHGFVRGRSTKTFTAPHIGQQAVLRLDLEDFFHSVPVARIGALFRTLGYPRTVAWLLQGLCTTSVSAALAGKAFQDLPWSRRKRLQEKHLAQGAPTSAGLANHCAWRLDCRLQGLADHFGFRYTRYADDMVFSGPHRLAGMSEFIEALTGGIAIDEGYRLNHRKTRLRLRSQRQCVAGIITNEKPNCRRSDWDRLKAILYNCGRFGPESQNRDGHRDFRAHLRGRVAYVSWLNPARGEKLWRLWQNIDWKG